MNNNFLFTLPVVSISGSGALFGCHELKKTIADRNNYTKDAFYNKIAFNAFLTVSNIALMGNAIANLYVDMDK